jgi:zinc protease
MGIRAVLGCFQNASKRPRGLKNGSPGSPLSRRPEDDRWGNRFAITLLLFFGVVLASPAHAMNIQRVVSAGGLEAWLVEEHAVPLIAMQAGFHGGSALEPQGREGLAAMMAALLDQGAGDLDARAFQERLADTAIDLEFSASRDAFYASFGTLSEKRDEAFALLSKALTAPRFDADPLARIRAQMLSRLKRESEDPDSIAARLWFAAAFPGHVYGRWPHGTPESITAVSADDLRHFAARILTRDRLTIAVVGDIDAATLKILLDKSFGTLTKTSDPDDIPETVPALGAKAIVEPVPNPQSVVIFGNKGLKRADPDFYAATVLNYILGGGGFASRLTHEIRETRGLVYSVSTGLTPLDHAGLMLGNLGTENKNVGDAVKLVRSGFKSILKDGVSEAELADAKTYLTGSYPLRFSSNSAIASELVGIQLQHLGIDYVQKRNSLIESVTAADVKRVAPRILDPDHLLITVVGDPKGL